MLFVLVTTVNQNRPTRQHEHPEDTRAKVNRMHKDINSKCEKLNAAQKVNPNTRQLREI